MKSTTNLWNMWVHGSLACILCCSLAMSAAESVPTAAAITLTRGLLAYQAAQCCSAASLLCIVSAEKNRRSLAALLAPSALQSHIRPRHLRHPAHTGADSIPLACIPLAVSATVTGNTAAGHGRAGAGTMLWHSEVGAMQLHHGICEGQAVAAQRVGLNDEAGALHGGEHAAEYDVVKLGCAASLLSARQMQQRSQMGTSSGS